MADPTFDPNVIATAISDAADTARKANSLVPVISSLTFTLNINLQLLGEVKDLLVSWGYAVALSPGQSSQLIHVELKPGTTAL